MRSSQLFIFVVLFSVSLVSTQATQPFEYDVIDNTVGTPETRFSTEVGVKYAEAALIAATGFALDTFDQSESGGRGYEGVVLIVESFAARGRPFAVATTNGSLIFVNADYLQTFSGDITDEFTGIVFFASGLVWQWTGKGDAPTGLLTGIATYIKQTAGWGYEGSPETGSGLGWDDGYGITANFLEYCDLLRSGFVSDLNAMMIDTYSDLYFWELLEKPVDELWEDYKLLYGTPGPASAPAPAQTFGY